MVEAEVGITEVSRALQEPVAKSLRDRLGERIPGSTLNMHNGSTGNQQGSDTCVVLLHQGCCCVPWCVGKGGKEMREMRRQRERT